MPRYFKLNLNKLLGNSLATGVVHCSALINHSGYKSFETIQEGDILIFSEKAHLKFLAIATSNCCKLVLPKVDPIRQVPFKVLHQMNIPIGEFDSTDYFEQWMSPWVKESRGEVFEVKHRNSFTANQFCTELKHLKIEPFLKRIFKPIVDTIDYCSNMANQYETMAEYCSGNYGNFKEAEINFRRIVDDLSETILKVEHTNHPGEQNEIT